MKLRITLKAKKDFGIGSTKEGELSTMINDVFCLDGGIAFWCIDRDKWDVILVERYTEKNDVNGEEIYEGDQFEYYFPDRVLGIVRFGSYINTIDSEYTEHIGFYIDWEEREKFKNALRKDLGYWANLETSQLIKKKNENNE